VNVRSNYQALLQRRASDQSALRRTSPRLTDYDYLSLKSLQHDIYSLINRLAGPGLALDLGCGESPYQKLLEQRAFDVRTLDISDETGPDYVGTAESTGLANDSFDLVLSTQVFEHVFDPWAAIMEVERILCPGGHLILSVPHVWFYHPHPHDFWRFTQEGIIRIIESSGLRPVTLLGQGGTILAFCQIVNFLVYGGLGRIGTPLFLVMNALARFDRVLSNELFCLNFSCLAKKSDAEVSLAAGAPATSA
jgi:SAM-dependent methyltransferase